MSSSLREEYNTIHYRGRPIESAFVPSIEAIARLHGLQPAPAQRCRVLELAGGEGTNLISTALMLPGSEFVGIDLADQAIRDGQETVAALGLTNVRLEAADIMALGDEWGQFDYILAHGFFSWVPEPVRRQILALCGRLLTPQGVAFISYNALPGGRLRQMTRDILRYHVRNFEEPHEKIEAARQFAQFLVKTTAGEEKRVALHREMQGILDRTEWGLYHDELAEVNEQFFFRDFMDQAAPHGLQFLAEADFASSTAPFLPEIPDVLEREQYIDFCVGRRFRQTLLCRSAVQVDRERLDRRIEGLYAAGDLVAPPDLGVASNTTVEFKRRKEGSINTNHPVMKVVLQQIAAAWSQAVPVSSLQHSIDQLPGKYDLTLGAFLLQLYRANVIQLYSAPFLLAASPGERPRSARFARVQLRHESLVTNLCHRTIKLEDEESRRFLALLDGSRDVPTIAKELGSTAEDVQGRLQSLADLGLLEA